MDTSPTNLALIGGVVALSGGLWFLLPPARWRSQTFGGLLTVVGIGLFAFLVANFTGIQQSPSQALFWTFAVLLLGSAVATVVSRNPVFSALWFGMTLLATAALLMFLQAQFLAVATVVVYAGAILVTFLFVLMLASPGGSAPYDRISWEALLSASTGAVFLGVLSTTLLQLRRPLEGTEAKMLQKLVEVDRSVQIGTNSHVAYLGRELFSVHLISVQAAGMLLFVALVGAAAIVAHGRAKEQQPG